jgi:hypothetical protein
MRTGPVVTAVALVACVSKPHVRLRAPDARAPEGERLGAYVRLRAHPRRAYLDETFEDLQLGDGTRVWHPTDILSVVPAGSRAALAAGRSESLRGTATGLRYGGLALVLAGGVWMAIGLGANADRFLESVPFDLAFVTIGGGVVVAALSAIPEWEANDATTVAFRSYDLALRRRLDLCVSSFQVVACR